MKFVKFVIILVLFIVFSLTFHNAIIGLLIALGLYFLVKYLVKFLSGRLKVIGMKTIIIVIMLTMIMSMFINIKTAYACSLVNEFTGGLNENVSNVCYRYIGGRNTIVLSANNIPDTDSKGYALYYDNYHPTYTSGVAYNVSYTIKDSSGNLLTSGSYTSGVYGISPSQIVAKYNSGGYDYYVIALNGEIYNAILNGDTRIINFSVSPVNTCLLSSYDENRFYMLNDNFTITAQGKNNITLEHGKIYNIDGQLQSYNCLTNQAVFQLSANFNLQSVNIDGLDLLEDTSKVLNYSFDSNTWNLTVNFSNTINENTTQHTLFITGSGIDPDTDSSVSAKGHIDFDTSNCIQEQPIEKGKLVIIWPANGEQFESGTTTINVKIGYGGNVESDFPNSSKYEIQGAIRYEDVSVVADIDLADYTIENNTTYWNATITLNNNQDGTYTMNASLFTDAGLQLSADSITFTIGEASGNPLIDFLNHLWQEFKEWFIETMKYLFVPTDAQMQELANSVQNLNLNNYIPFLNKADTQCDCLTLLDSDSGIFSGANIHWEICISSVPDNVWNIIKTGMDIFIVMALLFLIIKSIGA